MFSITHLADLAQCGSGRLKVLSDSLIGAILLWFFSTMQAQLICVLQSFTGVANGILLEFQRLVSLALRGGWIW